MFSDAATWISCQVNPSSEVSHQSEKTFLSVGRCFRYFSGKIQWQYFCSTTTSVHSSYPSRTSRTTQFSFTLFSATGIASLFICTLTLFACIHRAGSETTPEIASVMQSRVPMGVSEVRFYKMHTQRRSAFTNVSSFRTLHSLLLTFQTET